MRAAALLALLGTAAHAQSVSVPASPYQTPAQVQAAAVAPGGIARGMYASTCAVVVNSAASKSCFCPVVSDPNSVTARTYAAGALTPGKAFRLDGGGTYSVPTGNLNTADIRITVGGSAIVNLTTPAAPVGTNQGVDFHALCTVRSATTINCTGVFAFVVAGTTSVLAPFSSTGTFDPTVANLVDVLGDWNTNAGALTTQTTTVTQAVLTALN